MTELNNPSASITQDVKKFENNVHGVVDKLAGVASSTAEKLDQAGTKLHEVQSRLSANCGEYVQKNPVTALGVALASGLLLGLILRRH
jgi:ElaB/YqjD/DUF883 family membrane-anchored ribosome-binding protein